MNRYRARERVSDGVNVTLTDENGWYYLASAKECGHVFVCNPKVTNTRAKQKYPEFYKTVDTERPSAVEQADFELERTTRRQTIRFCFLPTSRCADATRTSGNMRRMP